MLVARNRARIKEFSPAIAKRVVGFSIVAESAGIVFRRTVEAHAVGVALFLPDPPAIVRPKFVEVAIAIAEEDDLRRIPDLRPAANIGFIWSGASERRRGASIFPMHIDRADATA
jgi:hypothetical protein